MDARNMAKIPIVSVIMPAYNAEKYIGEAIESIIKQSYTSWELIVIDDCSTDSTNLIVNKFSDARIHVYKNCENKGIAYTTNRAIQLSKGKYLALLDDDDISMLDRLEKQVKVLEENSNIDVLGGRTIYIDAVGNEIGWSPVPRINPRLNKAQLLFGGVSFSNSTAMIRRDFIEKYQIKYIDECCGMQDVRFYMECSKYGNISAIEDCLLKYRMHLENETTKYMTTYKERRNKKFAEIQKWSIENSGFKLEEDEMVFLNHICSENGNFCKNMGELKDFYSIMKKMHCQAIELDMDFVEELDVVLRDRICRQVSHYNLLFDDF